MQNITLSKKVTELEMKVEGLFEIVKRINEENMIKKKKIAEIKIASESVENSDPYINSTLSFDSQLK